ncbi:tRNA (adenosine(37)-N6)-threonylcarbamoyltransferase complex dimerization subunit type 1 TsaB [Albimonas sp. CAU 1670]|uniref:tRNA (adenosine(37)-N6)-threonylcarbamoyltransferase complex dimerization subunit type 1 TsaB n=1 Tax=Albimonas sp. CAU 1670 TaxID=3032599 RepID=UPI0023D99957|nr:tRNA (adenosine(37)-N6)-threonylcarbamoyltransferase complex dimerization subunit type 1 TsaB [Albimonas sp. CAU 1670]MDF2235209.1 tRNA (adenosine(37)-N6)-threonylcarbamoyltransferase complex dimerization subunit type 1 TsaB [Albimonas sp. CAU 1670]
MDASAAQCAAAVVSEGRVLAALSEPMGKGQAERLAPLIQEVLAAAGLAPQALAGIGVCTGPGNFTGVRIGVAAARGLALGIGRPSVGVPRLQALAEGAGRAGASGPVLALAGARRDERHAQAYELAAGPDGPVARPLGEAVQAPLAELPALFAEAGAACVRGPGAAETAAALGACALDETDLPDPVDVARIAARMFAALPAGASLPRPAPIYPRPPEADPPSETPPPLLDGAAG